MLGRSAATAARVAARSQPKGQKRTFIDYLTNYPDRVSSIASVPPERRPRSFSVSPPFRTGSYAESTYTTNGFDLLETVFCSCWSVVAYNEWVAWHCHGRMSTETSGRECSMRFGRTRCYFLNPLPHELPLILRSTFIADRCKRSRRSRTREVHASATSTPPG